MKIAKIIDDAARLEAEYGPSFPTKLELSGKLSKEYCGIDENMVLGYRLTFTCGPETVDGNLSDMAYIDNWLEEVLEPIIPSLLPDAMLSTGDAENCHSIILAEKISKKKGADAWKAISAAIDAAFAKV